MSQPQPQPAPVQVLCPECGQIIEIEDPAALVRALHLVNECSVRTLLTKTPEGG
jgi:hypothetical protein